MPTSPLPVLLLLLLPLLGAAQEPTARQDLPALYSLRASLGLRARDWPRKLDPCARWTGLTCRSGRVVGLRLSGLRRTRLGKRNPSFAVDGLRRLGMLESFNASGFLLPGPIPDWLGRSLPAPFNTLDLTACGVNGSVPSTLAQLPNLTALLLRGNRLGGAIPAALGTLRLLQSLDLAGNSLSGALPEELGRLGSLQVLDLSGNKLNGSLPGSIWNLSSLQSLGISQNRLTGMLPDGFGAPLGIALNLSGNLFYGNISSGVGAVLGMLRSGDISDNYFQGQVPSGLGNVSVRLNCFLDASDQRNTTECERFYTNMGLPYARPSPPPPPVDERSGSQRNWRLVYILVGVFGGLLLLAAVVFLLVVCLRRRTPAAAASGRHNRDVAVAAVASPHGSSPPLGPPANFSVVGDLFNYDQLLQATKSFSDTNLVKHGHTGDLYLGTLEGGAVVVVKRIDAEKVASEMYKVELDFFARVSHTRMVPLLGHCLEKEDEKLLVYKYMPNRDLSNALYRKPKPEEEGLQSLDWITRLKIAIGAAEALCYLHHECSPPIVHRDIQASSILLDDKFEVRLGSVSEACVQEDEGTHNVITRLLRISQSAGASTSGTTPATCAYDVYCLGKVLLELVTGKLGISGSDDAKTQEFIEQTMPSISIQEKEALTKILDPSLIVDEDLMEEVWAMAIVAKSCLNPKASKRPQAKIILKALENPLRVVRDENAPGSARLRATSSRGSWNAALFGSWRSIDKEIPMPPMELSFPKSSDTNGSQGSVGEQSFNRRKPSKEIFPEPSSGSHEIES